MRRRRLPLGIILPAALVVLVGTLATLQYRWLGQVSQAERDQLQRSLHQRAREFADDFDRELGQIYSGLQADGADLEAGRYGDFADRLDHWRRAARFPELVKSIYYAREVNGRLELRRYDDGTRVFVPADWPVTLELVRARFESKPPEPPEGAAATTRVVTIDTSPVMSEVPAIVIPVRAASAGSPADLTSGSARIETGGTAAGNILLALRMKRDALVVELDAATLTARILPAFAERHFPETGSDRYRVSIVNAAKQPVLSRGLPDGATIAIEQADVATPFFSLRLDSVRDYATVGHVMTWSVMTMAPAGSTIAHPPPPAPTPLPGSGERMSVVVGERRDAAGELARTASAVRVGPAAWYLLVQHADGSLDAAVANARRHNLWLSFSILAVLAMSVGLIVLNARRSERLAGQQMDFVATVSHELRTPLAVIRSAAQNLSAGVVHDAAQARRYGDLIEDEGRRLTDMVEQVLEYAGLSGNREPLRAQPVDLGTVARGVITTTAPLAAAEGFEVDVRVADDLPLVLADPDAVGRAITNLVTNALKYGREGRWLGLTVQAGAYRSRPEVQVTVSDRGRGIEADDLPHIFEPFYRGRYALDRQIQGNGLGLSLVRRIAEAHGGRVTVKSAAGSGSTFTIHLPAAAPDVERVTIGDPISDTGGRSSG